MRFSVKSIGPVAVAIAFVGFVAGQDDDSPRKAPPQKTVRKAAAAPREAQTFIPVIADDFENTLRKDEAERADVLQRQKDLLESRYDLSNDPSELKMSGGRKAVQ
ncbi:MAG: hypothetical protein WD648_07175, partial [Planctomycetaceae bacterium]